MSGVGEREKVCQKNVVQLFTEQLGYTYLGNLKDRENSNIEEKLLRKFLVKKGYDSELINLAIAELIKVSGNQTKSLFEVNKEVYSLLRYGVKKKVSATDKPKTVFFIDFEDFLNNDFYIAEEVTVKGNNIKRPDVVLYVNGIALGIIELKRSIVSISEGIRQNLDNQKDTFIRGFFNTIQLVIAGNDTQGAKYGVIGTTEKYYLTWKEDKEYEKKITEDTVVKKVSELCENVDNVLHKHLIGLFYKERFLEIIYDFIVYDRGIKKTCRPNQYFGVKSAHVNVKKREGGIIWHTQGSGKSLTMVWLTKWIMENKSDARVLVITDREELDQQIEKVYKGVDEEIYRTKSGRDLLEKLNTSNPRLLCSLIHKFGKKEEAAYEDYFEELKSSLPKDFTAKGDIYVLVDECHRTQSGKLHEAMKTILPNALFIGFTGTPLLKEDKQSSIETFGEYIHKYRFDEAVKDKVVLDLRYEARDVEQNITSQKKIDQWFDSKTNGLTDVALAQLKKRWGNLQSVFSSKARLEKIAADIILDMETKDRLKNGRGNAMLVAGSIYEACKYYEIFTSQGFTKCAIVTSYTPSISDIKGESLGEGEGATERLRKYEIYNKMLNGKKPDEFEKEVKELFINHPAQMKLLIVVDKLLTGFDAPPASYLYIDKSMRDHGLFQAICRVNRLDGDDKEFGYIIDYKDLFKSLESAMNDYTTNAFDNYEKADIEGLLKNRLTQAKEKLDEALETVQALCEDVEYPRETQQFLHYFCAKNTEDSEELRDNEPKRVALYKSVASLIRAYSNLANEMLKAGYTKDQANLIRTQVAYYEKVRLEVKLASGDYIDLKTYEPAMRHLIDTYIDAKESEVLSAFDDMSIVDLMVKKGSSFVDDLPKNIKKNNETVAETIENNVRRLIIDETPTNPKYFEKMSLLLDEIIRSRKDEVIEYKTYLEKMAELAKRTKHPEESSQYSERTNKTAGLRALYDNIGDEDLAVSVHEDIVAYKPDSWRGHKIKERKVKNLIKKHISDEELLEKIFEIVFKQKEY
ncbi:type I restriction endonuclease subunit R [Clostridium sp.]|uniref:type I restriction endonuclease subunit R n=1 Tax=Clostridium sp. TaxID=1506 RepID=UPI0025C581A5|nr:HsdR family type I site-specific deoxyribonuclease [Clostridium sp.]